MKNIKFLTLVIVVLFITVSCSKDDDVFVKETSIASKPQTETTNSDDIIVNNIEDIPVVGAITLYRVKDSNISKVQDYKVSGMDVALQKDVKKHQMIWSFIKKVAPQKYLNTIEEFLVYNGTVQRTGGFVIASDGNLSKWRFAIAIEDINNESDLVRIVIHELAHIITLSKEQIRNNLDDSSCDTFISFTGCPKKESYINVLFTKYWKDIYEEFKNLNSTNKQDVFLSKYGDRFLTQYAATNPTEDIAEAITEFVEFGELTGVSIGEKKVRLMHSFPEIVAFRNHVKKALNNSGLTRKKTRKITRKAYGCRGLH